MRAFDLAGALKESALVAGVALALCIALVGLRITDVPGGIDIAYRFDDVAMVAALAFLGRLGLVLLRDGRAGTALLASLPVGLAVLSVVAASALAPGAGFERWLPFDDIVLDAVVGLFALGLAAKAGWRLGHVPVTRTAEEIEAARDRAAARVQRFARYVGPVLLAAAIALPFMPFADRRVLDIAILVLTYVMLGWGLNIVVGLAGLLHPDATGLRARADRDVLALSRRQRRGAARDVDATDRRRRRGALRRRHSGPAAGGPRLPAGLSRSDLRLWHRTCQGGGAQRPDRQQGSRLGRGGPGVQMHGGPLAGYRVDTRRAGSYRESAHTPGAAVDNVRQAKPGYGQARR
jgi:hypothetical protein